MITKQLLEYVKNSLDEGLSEKEVEEKLVKQGWTRQEVKDTIQVVRIERQGRKKVGFVLGEKFFTWAFEIRTLKTFSVMLLLTLLLFVGVYYLMSLQRTGTTYSCEFPSNMPCVDEGKMRGSDNVVVLYLKNNAGGPISMDHTIKTSGSCKDAVLSSVNFRDTFPVQIDTDYNMVLVIQCRDYEAGYFKSRVTLTYTDTANKQHKVVGLLKGTAS